MDKIKQVFSHDSSKNASHSTGTHSTTGSNVAGTPSTTAGATSATGASTLASDNSSHQNASHSNGAPSSTVGATSATGASTLASDNYSHREHESAGEKLKEHAHPPQHHHSQPKQDGLLDERDAKEATHDHQHLAAVTHETHQRHEVEEIERQREVDRHVHHVQHHTQPVLDTQHQQEQHHEKVIPATNIKERHVATDEDKAMLASLNTAKDNRSEAPSEKVIIDKGEQVHTNTSHHVHHLVQPVIERDTHEHHKTHTVVPVHQETHEAPIVHQSVAHEPMALKDFVSGGGDLKSSVRHDASLLNRNEDCERTVDGPAETLKSTLGLGNNNNSTSTTTDNTRI